MSVDVAILGAGAWGTALANVVSRTSKRVRLHSWDAEHAARLQRERENRQFLPGVKLEDAIVVTHDMAAALHGCQWLLLVVPTQALRDTLSQAAPLLGDDVRLVSACKGIETGSLMLVHQVIGDVLGDVRGGRTVHLSGPSFAREVALGVPTNLVSASKDPELAAEVQQLVAGERLRVYTSDDPVGVEVGGALKNVIAIAAGACAGLGFGYNAQAALVTRGLAEMTRLSLALGGQERTLAGLSGLGDLILSATYDLSRNRNLGFYVGQGQPIQAALHRLGGIAEGHATADAAHRLAGLKSVDLPICEEVYQVLYHGKPVRNAVSALLARPLKKEWD